MTIFIVPRISIFFHRQFGKLSGQYGRISISPQVKNRYTSQKSVQIPFKIFISAPKPLIFAQKTGGHALRIRPNHFRFCLIPDANRYLRHREFRHRLSHSAHQALPQGHQIADQLLQSPPIQPRF